MKVKVERRTKEKKQSKTVLVLLTHGRSATGAKPEPEKETKMYTVTGNTYKAKDDLKEIGFEWNKEEKRWESENPNLEDWENKYMNPTWNGRKCARINAEANIQFVKV